MTDYADLRKRLDDTSETLMWSESAGLFREASAAIAALTDDGPGTPMARLNYLLGELERLFPDAHDRVLSDAGEPKYIAAIAALCRPTQPRWEGEQMSEEPATMNVNGKPTRCTVLEAYGQSGLNYRVRFEEDCALGKTGAVYIAQTRLLTFADKENTHP